MIRKSYSLCFILTCFFIGILFPLKLKAQNDSIISPPIEEIDGQLIEDFIQGTDEEGDFNFDTAFDLYRGKPLNLNKASREDLEAFGLLSTIQISDLLRHREKFSDLIAIYELQTIPSFDSETIQRIVPFVSTYSGLDDYQLPIHKMLVQGENELYLRWQKVLEKQKGYISLEEGETGSRYLGDQNKLYLRYRHFYQNRLSFGFTAEKDAGEEFFAGSNKSGFDFYSAHLFLNNYSKTIKAIALGDYKLSMGQGLIRFSGFGAGKSSYATSIKRSGKTLSKYSSVNETNFMRGAAATIGFGEKLELSAFFSQKKRDANLLLSGVLTPDTLILFDDPIGFTSLQSSGLHRTEAEVFDKNKIKNQSYGGVLKYKHQRGHLALNINYDKFDKPLTRLIKPYNRFYFSGDRLLNTSVDYTCQFQNLYFFGETAWSNNNRYATLNGLMIGLDRYAEVAILHRYFQKDYQAIEANPFSEKTGGRNEQGFYIGLNLRPGKQWKVNTYVDTYRHPWLLFDADGPSHGIDYLVKVTYWQKRKMEAYIQLKAETKQVNNPASDAKIDPLVDSRQFKLRGHISNKISKSLELRSRVYWGFAKKGNAAKQKGFAAYQDILYKPIGIPISFTTRFAIFDTDAYAIRFYAFENDLLYSFSVPAYYNKGTRYYLNIRYKGIRNMTLELRYSRTYWANQETFGSGLEEINGQSKSEVKAQVKLKF